ncbi:MAG: HAD family hydrolase [SAR202 cluster bacterium]|nr:hypothetical protein [Chloroflexota bacterium]MQG88815.1 HAD family hydrolase [SAR202 cluster bacterium]
MTAITLDLWQTLIFDRDGSAKSDARRISRTVSIVRELKKYGEFVPNDVVENGFKSLSEEITSGHDHGRDRRFEDWILTLVDQLVPGLAQVMDSDSVFRMGAMVDKAFLDSPPSLIDDGENVLKDLCSLGHKVGLISNTGLTSPQMYRRWLNQLGILKYFDFLAFSNEQEVAKPNRKIFVRTLDNLGVKAEWALHVGDNLHTDVGGAASVGMSTVWVKGFTSSKSSVIENPDFTVTSIRELPEIVQEWSSRLSN